ncbi:HRDC-domain-containing protein [Daldinia caldariorum]|uniref:HRDC-domain-containing protein n=1 Tax=Daldinia caldariorum TaxID=326644 RepID=UPI00200877E5|nr:HRDC-domain-containing protein [Daldinia caldariorum]KAI1464700.1 HRDC-domain-containing protein [Daldinia caldariorum]
MYRLPYTLIQTSRPVESLVMSTSNTFTSGCFGGKADHDDDMTSPLPRPPTENNYRATSTMLEDSSGPQTWHKLFGQLILHRKKLATAQDVPLYAIASNKALEQLAKIRPTNKNQLLKVKGIGNQRVEAYGDEWLKIISEDIAKYPKRSVVMTDLPSESRVMNGPRQRDNFQDQQESDSFKELYRRLAEHRRTCAIIENRPAYIVASNSLLESLARTRPSNQRELLNIHGIGLAKAAEYGSGWLEIIAAFEAEYKSKSAQTSISDAPVTTYTREDSQQPQAGDQPSKQRQIRTVGRSKEIILTQPFPGDDLSFEISQRRPNAVEAAEASSEKDESGDYGDPGIEDALETLVTPQSSQQLKRKQNDGSNLTAETNPSLTHDFNSTSAPTVQPMDKGVVDPEPLSQEQKILRKKLDAYVRSVVWAMDPKPIHPIVSEDTLQCLVATLPQTQDELHQVPGIERFLRACEMAKKDLWRTFSTWIQAPGLIHRAQAI